MKKKILILACGLLSLSSSLVPQMSLAGFDEDKLLQQLQSSFIRDRIEAARNIERELYDSPKLYEFIAGRLEKENGQNINTPEQADEVAWLCKALASSGHMQYRDLLLRINSMLTLEKPKLIRQDHCRQAADNLPSYAARQKVVQGGQGIEGLDSSVNKIVKLLRSGDAEMVRDGARMMMDSGTRDERAYDVARDVLMAGYNQRTNDAKHVDAMSWICKSLAATGLQKYKPDLQHVATTASNSKVSNYAKQATASLP